MCSSQFDQQCFIDRFDRMDIYDSRITFTHSCCFQRFLYHHAGRNNSYFRSLSQNDSFARFKYITVIKHIVDSASSQSYITRTVDIGNRFDHRHGFRRITRLKHMHAGNRAHQSDVFDRLMTGPVFSYGDTGMGRTYLDIQMRIPDAVSNLFIGSSRRKHCKTGGKHCLVAGSQPGSYCHHIAFRDSHIKVT